MKFYKVKQKSMPEPVDDKSYTLLELAKSFDWHNNEFEVISELQLLWRISFKDCEVWRIA